MHDCEAMKPVKDKSDIVYVPVGVRFNANGTMVPYDITWEDGVTYKIDEVCEIKMYPKDFITCTSDDRYTIRIGNTTTKLYFRKNRSAATIIPGQWYVIRKKSIMGLDHIH